MRKAKLRRRAVKRRPANRPRRSASASALAARREAKDRSTSDGSILIGGAQAPAEKAADRMAAQVLAGAPMTVRPSPGAAVHRKCAECEKDEKAQRSAAHGPTVAAGGAAATAGPAASSAIRSMGAGKPLARAERAFFEPRFGRDFSGVRVHDGPTADRAARSIDARAFAHGNDIAFARGERSKGGPRLMAHELAHVAQGDGSARRMVRRAPPACEKCPDPVNPTVDAVVTGNVQNVALPGKFGNTDWAGSARINSVELKQVRKKTCAVCPGPDGNPSPAYEFCPTKIKARATVNVRVNEAKIKTAKADGRKAYRDCTAAGRPNKWLLPADAAADAKFKRKTVAGVTAHELYHRDVGQRLWIERLKARNDIGKACPYTMDDHVKWLDRLEKDIKSDSETFLKGNPNEVNEEQNARNAECASY